MDALSDSMAPVAVRPSIRTERDGKNTDSSAAATYRIMLETKECVPIRHPPLESCYSAHTPPGGWNACAVRLDAIA